MVGGPVPRRGEGLYVQMGWPMKSLVFSRIIDIYDVIL